MEKSTLVLAAGLVGAVALALAYGSTQPSTAAPPPVAADPTETATQDFGELPPNHPAVDPGATGAAADTNDPAAQLAPPSEDPAALVWKAPAAWTPQPNPNSMRLATYKIPRAASDAEDAELAVTRAGGDLQSNVDRWKGQFQGDTKVEQSQKTVHGLAVTVVKIEGTYGGGMDPSAAPRPGWAMLAAIVATKDMPYFFKMTGPVATVRAAEKPFEAMRDALNPT